VALIDRRGLAAGSSGWKLRLIGFSESFSRICAMAGEPPSMRMALSTFLTMHGCSTEMAVLPGTRYQGATSSRPPGCDRILATAVLAGGSQISREQKRMKSRVRQPRGTKDNTEWLCKPEDGSSISNRSAIRLLEVLQISQAICSYGVWLALILWTPPAKASYSKELAGFTQRGIM